MTLDFAKITSIITLYHINPLDQVIKSYLSDPAQREFFTWYRKNKPSHNRPLTAEELIQLITIMLKSKKKNAFFDSIFQALSIDPTQQIWHSKLTAAFVEVIFSNKHFASICNTLSRAQIEITADHPIFKTEFPEKLDLILKGLTRFGRLNIDSLALIISFKSDHVEQIAKIFYSEYLFALSKQWDTIISQPRAVLVIRGASKLMALGYEDALKAAEINALITAPQLSDTVMTLEMMTARAGAQFTRDMFNEVISNPNPNLVVAYEASEQPVGEIENQGGLPFFKKEGKLPDDKQSQHASVVVSKP